MKIVGAGDPERPMGRRVRILKTVAVLPSLATLGNLVCGLGAIYLCMLSVQAGGSDLATLPMGSNRLQSLFPTFLAIAAYLVVAALLFDALDGRLARWARRTSEFGGQLDSLADIVSFGVAPAILVLCVTQPEDVMALSPWERTWWRAEWVMAATFVCCAALRLARFNVENVEDESSHIGFRGLPAPGAACALVGIVIFHQDLLHDVADLAGVAHVQASRLLALALPPFAMLLGLLMVSRFPYTHMVNTLLRGRRPFRQVVGIAVILLIGLIVQFQLTIAAAAAAYALSGPTAAAWWRLRGRRRLEEDSLSQARADWADQEETFAEGDEISENGDELSSRPAV